VAESFTTPEGTAAREELSAQLGRPVDIIADSTLAPDRFKLG
jgi:hypothetical protein